MAETKLKVIIDAEDRASSVIKKIGLIGVGSLAGIAAGAIKAVSDFGEFNESIQRAGAFVNASAEELKEFQKVAIKAAQGTKFSFVEVADALGSFVGGEIDAKEATEELANIIDLALVGNIKDLQQAVNFGSLALTVFKDDGMGTRDVIDMLGTVAAKVTTETERWSNSIVQSAGAAKAAGFSFKDLNVIFSAMKRGGADVNLMWAAFNSAVKMVQNPSKKTFAALDQGGLSVRGLKDALAGGAITFLDYIKIGFEKANEAGEGFAFLANLLGAQAAPEFALALGLTQDELKETAGWFENMTGTGDEMVRRIRDAGPPFDNFKQKLSELSITAGDALFPAMTKIIKVVNDIINVFLNFIKSDKFIAWMNEVKKIINVIVPLLKEHFGAAIESLTKMWDKHKDVLLPLLKIIGIGAAGTLVAALLAAAAAINLIASGLDTAITNIKKFIEVIGKVKKPLDDAFGGGIGGIVKDISGLFGKQHGGTVASGTPYLVGEQGPEVFVPSSGGRVIPNGQAGGAITVNFNNPTVRNDMDLRVLVDEVKRALTGDLHRLQIGA